MPRFAALLVVAILPGLAQSQVPGMTQIVEAKVEKGQFVWTDEHMKAVVEEVEVQTIVDGKPVPEKRMVVGFKLEATKRTVELKEIKATDAAGKPIPPMKLAELLREPTAVVRTYGPLTEKHRALFKDKVVFVELPPEIPKQIK